jgi:hypothetical protein
LFLAISAGAVLTVGILTVLGAAGIVSPIPGLPLTVVRVVGLVLLVVVFTVTGMLSGSIPPRQSGEDERAWWQANSQRAVGTWAMAEGLAVVGGVLYLLTSDLVPLVGLGGGGFLILLLNRPLRMMEG